MQIKYTIKPSTIPNGGLGLFADEFIPKGTIVWKFRKEDHIYYNSEKDFMRVLKSMSKQEAKKYINRSYAIDNKTVVYQLDAAQYMNHSIEKQNVTCKPDYWSLTATINIQKGDEIFENYLEVYPDDDPAPEWFESLEEIYDIWWPETYGGSKSKPRNINLSLIEDGWFYESRKDWYGKSIGYSVNKILALEESKYQQLFVFESSDCRVLVLDGILQFDTKYEHQYHEMIAHVPLFAHPNPKTVLIIGGGDAGCCREVIKHKSVENIVWVEIDETVINLSKKYFKNMYDESVVNGINNSRIKLIISDGMKYINECKNNTFDIIIVDGTDPVDTSPSKILFTKIFYSACYRILRNGGILCSEHECLLDFEDDHSTAHILKQSFTDLKGIFKNGNVKYFTIYTPMYHDG
eukprot:207606_1